MTAKKCETRRNAKNELHSWSEWNIVKVRKRLSDFRNNVFDISWRFGWYL